MGNKGFFKPLVVIIVTLVMYLFTIAPVAAQTPPDCTVDITRTVVALPFDNGGGVTVRNTSSVYKDGDWLVVEINAAVYKENNYLGSYLKLGDYANKTVFNVDLETNITYTQYIVIDYLDYYLEIYPNTTAVFGLPSANLAAGTFQRTFKGNTFLNVYDDFYMHVQTPDIGFRDDTSVRMRVRTVIVPETCPPPPLPTKCPGGLEYDFTTGLTPWIVPDDRSTWEATEADGAAKIGYTTAGPGELRYQEAITPGQYLLEVSARSYGPLPNTMQIGAYSSDPDLRAFKDVDLYNAAYRTYTQTVVYTDDAYIFLAAQYAYADYVCLYYEGPPVNKCPGGTLFDFTTYLAPWTSMFGYSSRYPGEENGVADIGGAYNLDYITLGDTITHGTYLISVRARTYDPQQFPNALLMGYIKDSTYYTQAGPLMDATYAVYSSTVVYTPGMQVFLWGGEIYADYVCLQRTGAYVPPDEPEEENTCGPFPEFPGWTLDIDRYFNWIGDILKWLWCNLEYWLRQIWLTLRSLTFADIVREFLETISQLWLWLKDRWVDLQELLGFELPDIFAILEEFWNTYIQPKWDDFWQWLQAFEWPDIWGMLTNFWNTYLKPVLDWIGQLLTNIWNAITALPGILINLLLALINGIWNALLSLPAWIWNFFWPKLRLLYDIVMAGWFLLQQLWAMRHLVFFPFKWVYALLAGVFSAFWFSARTPPSFGGPIWEWFVELMTALRTTPPFNYILWVITGIVYATVIQDVLDEVKEL